jgi:DNA-dependent RNA polymerase auxiliary subunit epsilon
MMIFKVYYQENILQVPVRENTRSMYVEADSEREVRAKLKKFNYNIELIQLLEGEFLEHEQNSTEFEIVKD